MPPRGDGANISMASNGLRCGDGGGICPGPMPCKAVSDATPGPPNGVSRKMLASAGSGARWTLAQRFIVRGHWRWQVHGEGRLLRKRLWIEPHFKGPVDIEAAIARTYEVGPTKEEGDEP